jgi:hypothetical protein
MNSSLEKKGLLLICCILNMFTRESASRCLRLEYKLTLCMHVIGETENKEL